MPVVKMPDGALVEMPDNPTPEQLSALQALTSQAKPGKGFLAKAGDLLAEHTPDIVKNIGTAMYKGAGDLVIGAMDAVGAQQDALDLAAAGFDKAKARTPTAPGEISAAWEASGYQPQGFGEKLLNSTIRGATAGVANPLGAALPRIAAISGAASGAGSEIAGAATDDSPIARLLGGLVGGVTGGVATAPWKNTKLMAREALEGVSPADLAKAEKNMQAMKAAGVDGNLSQAMPEGSNIDTLVNAVAQSRHGVNLRQQLREQPQAVAMGMEQRIEGLPGAVRSPQTVANNMQDAASAALAGEVRRAGEAWQKNMIPGEKLSQKSVEQYVKLLDAITERHPTQGVKGMAADVKRGLVNEKPDTPTLLAADGSQLNPQKWRTDALQIKEIVSDALDNYGARNLGTGSVDAKTLRRAQEMREGLDNIINAEAPGLARANAAYSSVMRDSVEPLKKSEIGRIAGRLGVMSDREAVRSKIFSILNEGRDPNSTSSELLNAEKVLRQVKAGKNGAEIDGSAAVQDAIKTWMSGKFQESLKNDSGRMSPDIALDLKNAFFKDDKQIKGFEDAMVAMARSQGLPDNALLPGMKKFMEIVSMASRRPLAMQGVAESEWANVAGGSSLGRVGSVSKIAILRQPVMAWKDFLRADAYQEMDRLLTSPEGVATLQKLAKEPVASPAAVKAVATYLGTQAQTQRNDK